VQEVFAGDWNAYGDEMLDDAAYFPPAGSPGNAALQVVATGPDQPYHVVERILLEALSGAEEEVWVASPYFVPSETVRLALGQASIRGVSVNLLIPGKSDRAAALWAGRSYYGELITEGVKIYEYGEGMVHSKVVAIDKRWCMVGTANIDYRSFRLNFEISVLGYDETMATAEDISNRSYAKQLLTGAARLLAPQL
jgi:cardiolipin synthase